jgi:hypothetical protein
MASDTNSFVHRFNPNGSIGSICRQCFATVASTRRESDLLTPENLHLCEPDVLVSSEHSCKASLSLKSS